MRQAAVVVSIPAACGTCHGKGPAARWEYDVRGELIPIPFTPCPECGLETPPSPSSISCSVSRAPQTDGYGALLDVTEVVWGTGPAVYLLPAQ